jgi:hypothetical protein
MIHGDCSSAGCYAMTDEQIAGDLCSRAQILLWRSKSFQIQAYPFRMTPLNMAKHHNSPHVAFWKMIKQGYDHFEGYSNGAEGRRVREAVLFNAESRGKFVSTEKCPAYRVPQAIASAVRDKQRRDDIQTAELINRGTPALPARMGVDGGMNRTFLSAVRSNGGPGATIRTASGTIPAHVNPPAEARDGATGSTFSLASSDSRSDQVQVASAGSGGFGSFFGNLFGSKRESQS